MKSAYCVQTSDKKKYVERAGRTCLKGLPQSAGSAICLRLRGGETDRYLGEVGQAQELAGRPGRVLLLA